MAKREDAPQVLGKPVEGENKKNGATKNRGPRINPESVITLSAEGNPKRPGSGAHERFGKYKNGMTVKQALEAGVTTADLRHDSAKGYIKFSA